MSSPKSPPTTSAGTVAITTNQATRSSVVLTSRVRIVTTHAVVIRATSTQKYMTTATAVPR